MDKSTLKKMAMAISFSLFAASNASVSFDIRGKIVESAADSAGLDSVPYAKLFLKNHSDVRCSTDEHGTFRLTNDPDNAALRTIAGLKNVQFRFMENRNGLFIHANNPGKETDIGVYTLDGRLLANAKLEESGNAERFIRLPHAARSVHMVKISTDEASWVQRITPAAWSDRAFCQQQSKQSVFLNKTSAAAFLDTLVVFLNGYKAGLFGINNYDTLGFVGRIEKSNTWNNCEGSILPRSRGMALMSAKNRDFEMGQYCDTIWGMKNGLPTSDNEQPVHTVHFTKDFYIDTVEIAQDEYDSLMKATYPGYGRPAWSKTFGQGPNYPVYSVSWDDAILFCNARSKRDHFDTVYSYSGITGSPEALSQVTDVSTQFLKSGYRLPTEAEWEYCCKAGKTYDFAWMRDADYYKPPIEENLIEVGAYEVWAGNSWDLGPADTVNYGAHPVGSLQPNSYGLHDMGGNVSEWCNDWAGKYPWGAVTDPTGPALGVAHVARGGNWTSGVFYLRGANRYYYNPLVDRNEKTVVGFRTVRIVNGNQ